MHFIGITNTQKGERHFYMHFIGINNTQHHKGILTCTSWELLTLNSTTAFLYALTGNY